MKRPLALLLIPALLLLGGCSLAREDAGAATGEDRLVGFLISQGSLNLFDADAYLADHLGDFSSGEVVLDGSGSADYQGKLYAEPESYSFTDSAETVHEAARYVFPGDYVAYAYVLVYDAPGFDQTYAQNLSTVNFKSIETDSGWEVAVQGTARVTPEISLWSEIFQMNPVYQSPDGRIYACEGHSFSADFSTPGEKFTTTQSDTASITGGGETESYDAEVAFTLSVAFAPEEIVVRQVAGDETPLSEASYLPGQLPESLTLEPGTAYLVVETHSRDADGNPVVTRELVECGAEGFSTGYAVDGFYEWQQTALVWP